MKSKKPIALMVFDPHLTKDNCSLVSTLFDQVFDAADDLGCSTVMVGGDVFTSRSAQPLDVLAAWNAITAKALNRHITLYVIPGNHDKTDPNATRSYLGVVDNNDAVILETGGEIALEGATVVMIPYFGNERWLEFYNQYPDYDDRTDHRFLLTHIAVEGVKNNDGSVVESDIKADLFEGYDAVFVGHYHNASHVGEKVHYLGSMYQNNFGETADDKGFTVLYSDGTWAHRPLEFPRYIRETVDATDAESLRNLKERYAGEDYDHIRFVVRGKRADCEAINASELSALGIEVKFEPEETAAAMETAETPEQLMNMSSKDIVHDFIDFCRVQNIKGARMKEGLYMIKEQL